MNVAALEVPTAMPIYPFRAFQFQDDLTLAALQWDKAVTEIPAKYFDYTDVFFLALAIELPENTGMNKHAMRLIDEKQPPYRSIYAFCLVELKTLKSYIKTH